MAEINYTRPFLYKYQRAILDSPARFTVTEAATKVGKTASHIIWLFEKALGCKTGQSVWWVAPTAGQAKIAYDRMKVQITDKRIFTANETNKVITLITGAKIEFKTAEKPDNLYGDDVYAAVFDEFTRAREASWFALRSTLTSTGGPCKFIGNVKGKKNWGHVMAMKAKSGQDGYAYFKITAYDAAAEGMLTKDGRPFIEEIEEAKRDLPELVFNELYLAEANEDGSNPFGITHIRRCVIDRISLLPPVCFGIDLANSIDYVVIIGLDQFAQVCYFDRFNKTGWTNTKNQIGLLPKIPMLLDSTGSGDPVTSDVMVFQPKADGYKFDTYSKQRLMEALAMGIQQRKIGFPGNINGVTNEKIAMSDPIQLQFELEQFEFEYTRTGIRYTAPQGMHDDCVCALALAYHQFKSVGTGTISWI